MILIALPIFLILLSVTSSKRNASRDNTAHLGQFPFAVYVSCSTTASTMGQHGLKSFKNDCTGFIIRDDFVVVPTHCVSEVVHHSSRHQSRTLSEHILLRAGTVLGWAKKYTQYGGHMQERRVPVTNVRFLPLRRGVRNKARRSRDHLHFKRDFYDIALVKVAPAFDADRYVQPISSLKLPFPDRTGDCFSVTYNGSMTGVQQAKAPVLKFKRVVAGNLTYCKQLKVRNFKWKQYHACSKVIGGVNPCIADWGGPLICRVNGVTLAAAMDIFYFGDRVIKRKATCTKKETIYKAYFLIGYIENWIKNTTTVEFSNFSFASSNGSSATKKRGKSSPMIKRGGTTQNQSNNTFVIILLLVTLLI